MWFFREEFGRKQVDKQEVKWDKQMYNACRGKFIFGNKLEYVDNFCIWLKSECEDTDLRSK